MLQETPDPQELLECTESFRKSRGADVALGVAVLPAGEKQDVHLVLITPDGEQEITRPLRWSAGICLAVGIASQPGFDTRIMTTILLQLRNSGKIGGVFL